MSLCEMQMLKLLFKKCMITGLVISGKTHLQSFLAFFFIEIGKTLDNLTYIGLECCRIIKDYALPRVPLKQCGAS